MTSPISLLRTLAISTMALQSAFADPSAEIIGKLPAAPLPSLAVNGYDGYIYGMTPAAGSQGGSLYRYAPGRPFQILHRFPNSASAIARNTGGALPVGQPAMGADGFLHGLTAAGGAFGKGVLYRVRPDGKEYSAIDLDPSALPAGAFHGDLIPQEPTLMETASGTFRFVTDANAIVMIARTGVLSVIYQNQGAIEILPMKSGPYYIAGHAINSVLVFTPSGDSQLKIDNIELNRGILQSARYTQSLAGLGTPIPLFGNGTEVLFAFSTPDDPNSAGTLQTWRPGNDPTPVRPFSTLDRAVIPDGKIADRFLAYREGKVYFSAGTGDEPGHGNTVVEIASGTAPKVVVGVGDGKGLHSVAPVEGALHQWAALSGGSRVYIPHDGVTYTQDWMSAAKASTYDVLQGSPKSPLLFRFATAGESLQRPFAAEVDTASTRGSGLTLVRPLRNDHTTQVKGPLQLSADSQNPDPGVVKYNTASGLLSTHLLYSALVKDQEAARAGSSIFIRGDSSGVYVDPAVQVRNKPLSISVNAAGRFTVTVPDGTGKFLPLSGILNYHDQGLAVARLKDGTSVRFYLELEIRDNNEPDYYYTLINAEKVVTGIAYLK